KPGQRRRRSPGRLGGRLAEAPPDFRQPLFGALPPAYRFLLGEAGGHEPGPLGGMVEGDDPVIEPDGQVGELKLVRVRAREAFEMMTQVIAKDSGRPTLKRG